MVVNKVGIAAQPNINNMRRVFRKVKCILEIVLFDFHLILELDSIIDSMNNQTAGKSENICDYKTIPRIDLFVVYHHKYV